MRIRLGQTTLDNINFKNALHRSHSALINGPKILFYRRVVLDFPWSTNYKSHLFPSWSFVTILKCARTSLVYLWTDVICKRLEEVRYLVPGRTSVKSCLRFNKKICHHIGFARATDLSDIFKNERNAPNVQRYCHLKLPSSGPRQNVTKHQKGF